VDLANVEPGTYEVRAVAKGKGTDRSTSQPRRIAIPPNNASLESRDRPVEADQPETEVSEGAADESPERGDDRHTGDGRAEESAAPSAPEVIADNANQAAESSRDHKDQKHKDRKHRGEKHERHGERRSR